MPAASPPPRGAFELACRAAILGDTALGDTVLGDTVLGDTVLGDTALGDTALGEDARYSLGGDVPHSKPPNPFIQAGAAGGNDRIRATTL